MADFNGYTGIPETLPEAQASIVRLLDEAKVMRADIEEQHRALEEMRAKLEAQKSLRDTAHERG